MKDNSKTLRVITDKRSRAVWYLEKWIGTPYIIGGDDFSGFDCNGIAHEVLQAVGIEPEGMFDFEEEVEIYAKKFMPVYSSHFESAGRSGMKLCEGKLWVPDMEEKDNEWAFIFTEDLKAQLEKIVENSGKTINTFTMKKLLEQIKLAYSEDWTVEMLTQAVTGTKENLVYWFNHHRARKIARTEMAGVENYGQLEGYEQTPFVDKKGWLCAFVELTREDHKKADADFSANPIKLDQPFNVGGEPLMRPCDPSGSAGNIINCLCTTFPDVESI